MSIYDKSSLVLIPSGTKTGKVFSQKPVSGDGDFTFTRSSAATRVNADGNIEKETQNLLYQSNNFSSGFWTTGATLTSGQSGYDGSSDAWLMTNGNIVQSITNTGVQTFSVYAKANTLDWIFMDFVGVPSEGAYFDVSNGVVGTIDSGSIDANIESVGSGWYRCSIVISTSSATGVRFYTASADGNVSGSGSVYIQDAQLEQGLVARDYIETTSPVYGGITDNTPRLDYTDSSCPALLLEPLRTNLMTHSELISAWDGYSATITENYATSPEGVQNAVRLEGTGTDFIRQNDIIANPSNKTYTSSFWAKNNGGDALIVIQMNSSGVSTYAKTIDLTDEWQRFEFTQTYSASDTGSLTFRFRQSNTIDCLVYGFQLEEGSYATSYIPTYGSSVSRVGELCVKTGISNLIGQTEGTLFLEAKGFADEYSNNTYTSITNSTGSNRIIIGIASNSNQLRIVGVFGGVSNGGNNYNITDTTSYFKVAVKYYNSTIDVFINGVKQTSQSFVGFSNSVDAVRFDDGNGALPFEGDIKQRLIFPTALTDQELIDLTTL
jgi:hypothetical protein